MNNCSCSTLFCVFCLWTAAESTTRKPKRKRRMFQAQQRRWWRQSDEQARSVWGVRETQPAFWKLPREGANQSRRLIRRFYTQASVSKNCVDFPNVLDDNVFSSIFFISFFKSTFFFLSFFFVFLSNFGHLKISQQFQSFQFFFLGEWGCCDVG